jgi:endonuclease YncB( thermonuclease family)
LLRYVERGKKDVGRAQIARGWAEVFVFEDPFKRVRAYRKAEGSAEDAAAGMWGMCGGDFHKPLTRREVPETSAFAPLARNQRNVYPARASRQRLRDEGREV